MVTAGMDGNNVTRNSPDTEKIKVTKKESAYQSYPVQ